MRYYTNEPANWHKFNLQELRLGDEVEDSRGIVETVIDRVYDQCGHVERQLTLSDPPSNFRMNSPRVACKQCGYPGAYRASVPSVADVCQRMSATGDTQEQAVENLGGEN